MIRQSPDFRRKLPPLNALKAFEATARHLSVTQAAAELRVTPGAVSQQIKVLEDHAGGPLFQRDAKIMALTPLGVALQPSLREAFELLKRAADIIYGAAPRQSLTVSAPPSFVARWLVPRMARFSAKHPEVEVWVSADMQLADVAGGRVDVAVRYGRGEVPGVRSETLFEAGVMPVCHPSLLEGPRPLRRPADLAHHALIHVSRSSIEEPRPDWAAWLAARQLSGIDATIGSRFDQTAMAIEDAAHGRGVALAPRAFVTQDLASNRLVAPFADGYLATDTAYRVLTRRSHVRPEAQAFLDWLRVEAARTVSVTDEL